MPTNTYPKTDRSKALEDQDLDMLLHATKETIARIVARVAEFETLADLVNQMITKLTIVNRGNNRSFDYAIRISCDFNSLGLKFIYCFGFAASSELCPRRNMVD